MRESNPEEILRRAEVQSTTDLIRYAAQRLGCPKPVGHKARGKVVRAIREEMQEQGWSIQHLAAAVDYMKARGIRAKSVHFLLFHVQEAVRQGYMPRQSMSPLDDLESRVAEAIYMESDETWTRRLLSAKGEALAQVYEKWSNERLPALLKGA